MSTLQFLDLSHFSVLTDDHLATISAHRGLTSLKLYNCKNITSKGLAHLGSLPALQACFLDSLTTF